MSPTLETFLAEHDPARTLPPYTPDQRAQLLADAPRRTSGPNPPTRKPRRLGRTLVAAALITGATAGVSYQGLVVAPSTAYATEVLGRATVRGSQSAPAASAKYWRVTRTGEQVYSSGDRSYLVNINEVDYVPIDGSKPLLYVRYPATTVRQLTGSAQPREARAENIVVVNDRPRQQEEGAWQNPTPRWCAGLPRDAAALRSRLYGDATGHGSNLDQSAFTYATDALRSGALPPGIEALLLQVLGTIPGVRVVDDNVAIGQKTGVEIGQPTLWGYRAIVVDPESGALLGELDQPDVFGLGGVPLTRSITREAVAQIPPELVKEASVTACTRGPHGYRC